MTAALNQLARMSAASMLNCMLEGVAIGLFTWLLLRMVGRRNSSTRFAVWFSALLAIAALPLVGGTASKAGPASITVPGAWALDIFLVWAVVAGIALLRVAMGLLQLRKLRRSCSPIEAATLSPVLRQTLQEFQTIRSVELCQSDCLQVPTAIGFSKPAVVIPSWAMQELSAPELNSILLHELAHLRRRDDWTNLAQQILKALLFFHPAVWWIESHLALEREMACDDAVLAATANPRDYAQCLIAMAEKSFTRRTLALAQAAVNRMRHMSQRVAQILDTNRSNASKVWKPALFSVAAFFVACLLSLPHAPELVAFEDRAAQTTVASAIPASGALIPAAHSDSFVKPIAIEAAFHPNSDSPTARHPATPERLTQLRQVRARADSPAAQNARYRIQKGARSLVPQAADNAAGLQPLRREVFFDPASEAAFGLPDNPDQTSARLLKVQMVQSNPSGFAEMSRSTDDLFPQAIFVVMQTAEYRQAGPMLWTICVWRVTVLESSRIAVETRIPAKQI
jgi:beta-lactamase regulating signal transducer with metallopeptidase domain